MDFKTWEPLYSQILKDFGYNREQDEYSAELLSTMIKADHLEELRKLIKGRDVFVCGKAKRLKAELKERGKDLKSKVIISADGATSILLSCNIYPQVIVSDLDGDMKDIIRANRKGAIVVVHAHGDNIDKLKQYVPLLKNIVATTQSKPLKKVYNFGGFTDGDRAVFLAKAMGAASITLLGFFFEDKSVSETKQKKLKWAKKLIGEQF